MAEDVTPDDAPRSLNPPSVSSLRHTAVVVGAFVPLTSQVYVTWSSTPPRSLVTLARTLNWTVLIEVASAGRSDIPKLNAVPVPAVPVHAFITELSVSPSALAIVSSMLAKPPEATLEFASVSDVGTNVAIGIRSPYDRQRHSSMPLQRHPSLWHQPSR